MKLLIVTLVLLVLPWKVVGAEPWYYTDNTLEFQTPDKLQHYYGSYVLSKTVGKEQAFVAGLIWEIKDRIAGREFGEKDLLLDFLGSYRVGYLYWDKRNETLTFQMNWRF